jgi:hypothetical protein
VASGDVTKLEAKLQILHISQYRSQISFYSFFCGVWGEREREPFRCWSASSVSSQADVLVNAKALGPQEGIPDRGRESVCSFCRWGKEENPYPYLGENRANPPPPICHNISLFHLQAMGLVRAISLRLRKGTTVFPRQGNRQIHGL